MADPVAWTMVEAGWDVVSSDGEKVGAIAAVDGDESLDIFDGIEVRKGADILSSPKYVAAEHVGAIEVGTVYLTVDVETYASLDDER
jgi:hypothetical protein